MPRYLIHVGPHKTGTTYLQHRFAAARLLLREQGVLYPAEWSSAKNVPSHQKLFRDIRAARRSHLRFTFDRIARSGAEQVLISAEDISHLDRQELGFLRELIGASPAIIIFYMRRWSELLPSLWQERVKHGYDETFPEFFAANVADPSASPVLNFAYSLDKYASTFGRENIKAVSYSNLYDARCDLAEHFFASFLPQHRLDASSLPPIANPRPNQSFPHAQIEVIRALNAIHAMHGGEQSADLRVWYLQHGRTFDLSGLLSAIEANMQTLRFSDASPAMVRLHADIWEAYADVLVAPAGPEHLFAARMRETAYAHPRYFASAAARIALEKIYAAYSAATRQEDVA